MKTKEELFESYPDIDRFYQVDIFNLMEEYAKEKSIEFILWLQSNCEDKIFDWEYENERYSIEELAKIFFNTIPNTKHELNLDKVSDKLSIGNFTINKPKEWETNLVELEIKDYDYDSTKIELDDLKALYLYIGQILNK